MNPYHSIDVGDRENEIPQALRDEIEKDMRGTIKKMGLDKISTPFDLAVDTSHGLKIVCAENDWEIPAYVVDIAERLFKTA